MRGRGGGGVTRVRVAVPPYAGALGPERLAHARADDDTAERHVPGGDALREGQEVGLEPEAAAREPVADATEAADHLVHEEQHVALAADLLHAARGSRRAAAGRRPRR